MPLQNSYPELDAPDDSTFVTGFYTDESGDLQTVKIPSTFTYGSKWTVGEGAPTTPGVGPGDMYLDILTGEVYVWNATTDTWGSPTTSLSNGQFTLLIWVGGLPANGQELYSLQAPWNAAFPAGLTGSVASSDVAATASSVFSLLHNGTQVGTLTFAASSTTGVWAMASELVLSVGDILTLVAPAVQDATLADIRIALLGGVQGQPILLGALGGPVRPSNPYLYQRWIDTTMGPYGQEIYCAQLTPTIVWANTLGVAV